MAESKRLSIIIPYRNTFTYLKKLLDDIKDFHKIDVIVIDDSSDKFVEEYKALTLDEKYKEVIFLRNDSEKRSAGICRNMGLDRAVGEWVLFADSDDYFFDGFYEIVEEYFDSDNDVVFFMPKSMDLDTGEEGHRHKYFQSIFEDYLKNKDHRSRAMVRYKMYVPWSKLIKMELIKKHDIRFDSVFVKNDSLFSVTVGNKMDNFHIDERSIYCVTSHSKGHLTTRNDELFARESTISRVHLIHFLDKNLDEETKKIIELNNLAYYHIEALKNNKVSDELIEEAKNIFEENGIKVNNFYTFLIGITKKIKKR